MRRENYVMKKHHVYPECYGIYVVYSDGECIHVSTAILKKHVAKAILHSYTGRRQAKWRQYNE